MKTKKRALIDSWISAVFCLVLLVGVTFAWFTTGTYIKADMVQAGEMEVEFVDENGTAMQSKKLKWLTSNINYWEPGCTYYTEPFTVKNAGDLYFKYKLSIEGFTGDEELLEVIDFHIYKYDTKTKKVLTDKAYEGVEVAHKNLDLGETYVLAGTMSADAGNEYQGMKLRNATVVLKATQISGNEYADVTIDNSGELDLSTATPVANFADFKAAIAAATEENPAMIVLTDNIEVGETIKVQAPVNIYSFTDNTITLSAAKTLFEIKETGSLYMEGITVTATEGLKTASILVKAYSDMELRDCAIENIQAVNASGSYSTLIQAYKEADINLINTTIQNNGCLYVIYDQKTDSENDRVGTAVTNLQYCNIINNTIGSRMFYIYTAYSVAGGSISGNTVVNTIFQLQGDKAAKLDLRYVTMKNNTITGTQAAIAWVRDYATMTIREGTLIEGNTASLSYGNIKVATKGILNVEGGTIKPITGNGNFLNNQTTDNFTGLVNDQGKGTVTISKDAMIEGTHSGLDGYTSGSKWPAN